MEEFELPLIYKGTEHIFNAKLQVTGYSYRFIVDVNGQNVTFEPDEERKYRALVNYEELDTTKTIDKKLIQVIAEKITELFS